MCHARITKSPTLAACLFYQFCLSSRNGNRVRQIDIELGWPKTNIDPILLILSLALVCVNSFWFFLAIQFTFYLGKDHRVNLQFSFSKYVITLFFHRENLSSFKVVLKLETPPAGSFAGGLFVSLVVLLFIVLISLKRKNTSEDRSENT